jgi:hypothetical protein
MIWPHENARMSMLVVAKAYVNKPDAKNKKITHLADD